MSFHRSLVHQMRVGLSMATVSLCLALPASAQLSAVAPGTLTTNTTVTVNDVVGSPEGTNYDGIVTSGGLTFAERFVGQIRTTSGDHDVLSGTPTNPLALQVGAANQNLVVVTEIGPNGNVIGGLGPLGFNDPDATGEGSMALLFPTAQFEFGFDLVGAEGDGDLFVSAFTGNGTLIQTVTLTDVTNGSFAFRREGNVADIAGIAFWNNEDGGLGFDNIRYSAGGVSTAAPEPATVALLLPILGLAIRRRRK
jgi:hypothetical protein